MQVCTSLQTDNHASTPLLSFLQAGCTSCRPTNSVKALKANISNYYYVMNILLSLRWKPLAFSALTLLVGRQVGHLACKNWVVGCWCGWFGWAFWYWLTRVVLEKGPLNGCVCVFVLKEFSRTVSIWPGFWQEAWLSHALWIVGSVC